jgi:thymidylate kinase
MERVEKRREREMYESLEFQIKVIEEYKALLPRYEKAGVRVVSIDAALPPEEVSEEIWRALQEMPIVKG